MNIDLNKNYPGCAGDETVYQWGSTNAVCIDKATYNGCVYYDFCIADRSYPTLVSCLFDVEKSLFAEDYHKFLVRDFDDEDLNTLAEYMKVTVDADKEQTAKNIISEIERAGELVLKQKPVSSLSSWTVKTKEGLVFGYNKGK